MKEHEMEKKMKGVGGESRGRFTERYEQQYWFRTGWLTGGLKWFHTGL